MTDKLSDSELLAIMQTAQEAFPVGRCIMHIKSRLLYFVHGHALEEATLRPLVIYSPVLGERVRWARPMKEIRVKFRLLDAG